LAKRQQDEVCVERLEQIRIRDEIADEKRQEEQMYARLWEEDMLSKARREERDAQAAHERNTEVLSVLRKQMAALEATKQEGVRLKEEEAQLLVSTINKVILESVHPANIVSKVEIHNSIQVTEDHIVISTFSFCTTADHACLCLFL